MPCIYIPFIRAFKGLCSCYNGHLAGIPLFFLEELWWTPEFPSFWPLRCLLPPMHLLMSTKVRSLCEPFAAYKARIRLLTDVQPQMIEEGGLLWKAPSATSTRVWFLTRVNSQMPHHVRLLGETFSTNRARKGLYSSVDLLVVDQNAFLREAFPTEGTGERLDPSVKSLMHKKTSERGKPFPTNGTGKHFAASLSHACNIIHIIGRNFLRVRGVWGSTVKSPIGMWGIGEFF